ncbi:MAG: aldehyde dehydrogenase family protein [Armatimonas sp.]
MASVAEIFKTMDYGPAPEGAAPAYDWLKEHNGAFGHFIDGAFTKPSKGTFETTNPATGKLLATISQGTEKDIDTAVKAARAAQPGWEALGGHARARLLYALARQIQKHSRLFAVLETLDNGKPIRETRDLDIPLVARHFYHHAGWAQLRDSELPGCQPIGVVGQIIPWNFPLLMLAWKISPAIAMGNTVVLKPAEFTPLTALLFAEICQRVGLPKGVVNIVTGDGDTGAALVAHSGVDKIAFTGSTEVGRKIRQATAGTGKKLSLELGGKSPFIVFEDADLDSAVEGVVDAIWFNQGQVCCAGSRLLVQESVETQFLEKLKRRMATLRVGDPLDKVTDIGAIVAPVQLARITDLVGKGVAEGATLYQPTPCPKDGCFYPPTLLSGVAPASLVAQEEIFGPVLVSMPFRTAAEAVSLANNTRYGLAASLWTENITLAIDTAGKLKAGTVWVNSTNFFDAASGFGGYRESGYGREGGKEGLWEYVKSTASTELPPCPPVMGGSQTREGTIDQTPKLYIGGKQVRPDSGYSITVGDFEVGEGNRKDIRNAVEAARAAAGKWATTSGHGRAQILYYLAENLEQRAAEFNAEELERSLEILFSCAAWADKYDGNMHRVAQKAITLAIPEPLGVIGVACPAEFGLLGLINAVAPALAIGSVVIAVPSEADPVPATRLYQVLETSDVPAGVVNIVTGKQKALLETLAGHDDVEGVWAVAAPQELKKSIEALSAGNMKRVWAPDSPLPALTEAFHEATQVKNVWIPYTDELPW